MDVLIGTRRVDETIPCPEPGCACGESYPAFVAEVFTPEQWRAGEFDSPLFRSRPNFGLNAASSAIMWARHHGYRVLTNDEAWRVAGGD